MGELKIRCPKTGKAVTTGIYIERARSRSMPVFFSRSFCPSCGTSHEWFARDAWVWRIAAPWTVSRIAIGRSLRAVVVVINLRDHDRIAVRTWRKTSTSFLFRRSVAIPNTSPNHNDGRMVRCNTTLCDAK